MFMNKSGTPKRGKIRRSVKVTAQNSEYIQKWIGKDEVIAKFVNDAVLEKHLKMQREKEVSDYKRMLESDSFYKIEKLKKNVDELKRNTSMFENKISVLEKDNAHSMKYMIKMKDEMVVLSELGYKRLYALDKKAAKRIFKK